MVQKITAIFKQQFNHTPSIFRSPGRVNILGEHTDYNEGFVLPAAIDKNIYVAISKRTDRQVNLYAVDFNEALKVTIDDIKPSSTQWANYILGVVDQLLNNGCIVGGFNLVIDGDIPIGAGLSSSAAVECATIYGLNEMFELGLNRLQMTAMAQKAEHEYAGVKCGIMDQFASMFGKKDQVIKLDCRSLEYEYVPFKIDGYKILLLNTNVKHNLAASEYNTRRQQCEQGVDLVKSGNPEVLSLRDVTLDMLQAYVEPFNKLVYQRCKYVVMEHERLLHACEDLRQGNIKALGEKMFETHAGLKDLYDVSCKELDFLVDYVKQYPAVAGARMMGGGFGGCTINLVKEEAIDALVKEIRIAYTTAMKLPLSNYIATIADGTGSCSNLN